MAHNVKTTRDELIQILQNTYNGDDVVDLSALTDAFAQKESLVRLELFLPSLLTSLYVLHDKNIGNQEIVVPLEVYDIEDLATILVDYLNNTITEFLDPSEVVLVSSFPEILEEIVTNGNLSDVSEYDPANIKLAIQVVASESTDTGTPASPSLFDEYDCTKIRIVI